MALQITHAILHTIGNRGDDCRYSDAELEMESEISSEFVGKHVRRLLHNPGAREATFTAESAVYDMVKGYQKGELHFSDMSRRLCERLAGLMEGNEDIPPADVLVAAFDQSGKSYLAIVKLNYGECFTHKLTAGANGGVENHIIKNTTVLPLTATNVEEACLIPYDPMVMRVLEKPHGVNGEKIEYFSKLFLECETELSKKEAAEAIQEIADEIGSKYYDGNLEAAAKIKAAFLLEAEEYQEEDGLVLENVVARAYGDNEAAKTEFVALAKDYGLPHQVMLDKPFVKREFKVQKFAADNGIELKCPAELFQDPGQVHLVENPDGTLTITLRNLRPKS